MPRSPAEIRAKPILCLQVGHIGRSIMEKELRIPHHPLKRYPLQQSLVGPPADSRTEFRHRSFGASEPASTRSHWQAGQWTDSWPARPDPESPILQAGAVRGQAAALRSVDHLDDLLLAGINQHGLVADCEDPVLAEFRIGACQFLRYRLQRQAT